ncbi:MAG: type II toxin-antitoxin system PemK/MazF family toxin [Kiritimatiellia bacterium]|jgi:mRNA interferase MazF|nr:type II toxin-antitoxin system PemK/MazF family toxin [Kiritimatiellia bacterium]MDP6809272.1 type II toxin-antitoxin system PemK/MazF family toxin [Kiritimatiellia bacterium]MDP7023010.1 type II toxin-antitoxin system PemK/MazF family toxin [Kiritimatiellia bacterium]
MVSPSVGSVVLVRFPFSDLSASKLRPAVVLAGVDRDDWILCQITSNPYADTRAVEIGDSDFVSGNLMRTSYARPGKLFSANTSLMQRVAGSLTQAKVAAVVDAVVDLIRP